MSRKFIPGWVGGLIILLDQVSKAYIHHAFMLHESMPVISGFFSITYLRNRGAAFGILANQSNLVRAVLLGGTSLAALALLLWMFYQASQQDLFQRTALSLIIGGAIGNILDRVRMGEVIDFLDFYVGNLHWPAFNVADSAITVGVALLLLHTFRAQKDVAGTTDAFG